MTINTRYFIKAKVQEQLGPCNANKSNKIMLLNNLRHQVPITMGQLNMITLN